MKKILLVLLIAAFGIASAFAQKAPQSRVETDTIYSEVLKAKRAYTVYLPPSFDADKNKKYPVLYLLHGMWDDNLAWANKGRLKDVADRLIASGEACEMIIVTPDAGGGDPNVFQNGYFNMPDWKYEDFFYNEFMPHIEKKYRVCGQKGRRALAGLSMGGGGATSYGQRHADKFCAVYAMSALMDIPDGRDINKPGKLGDLTRSVIENSCVKYLENAKDNTKAELRTLAWFVDCGDDDFLLDCNIEFYRAMRRAGIPCQFRVRDGGHDWEYWHSALYNCLPFVSRNFEK